MFITSNVVAILTLKFFILCCHRHQRQNNVCYFLPCKMAYRLACVRYENISQKLIYRKPQRAKSTYGNFKTTTFSVPEKHDVSRHYRLYNYILYAILGNLTFHIECFLSYCTDFKAFSTCKIPNGSVVQE
jgi:hypothetical protein